MRSKQTQTKSPNLAVVGHSCKDSRREGRPVLCVCVRALARALSRAARVCLLSSPRVFDAVRAKKARGGALSELELRQRDSGVDGSAERCPVRPESDRTRLESDGKV